MRRDATPFRSPSPARRPSRLAAGARPPPNSRRAQLHRRPRLGHIAGYRSGGPPSPRQTRASARHLLFPPPLLGSYRGRYSVVTSGVETERGSTASRCTCTRRPRSPVVVVWRAMGSRRLLRPLVADLLAAGSRRGGGPARHLSTTAPARGGRVRLRRLAASLAVLTPEASLDGAGSSARTLAGGHLRMHPPSASRGWLPRPVASGCRLPPLSGRRRSRAARPAGRRGHRALRVCPAGARGRQAYGDDPLTGVHRADGRPTHLRLRRRSAILPCYPVWPSACDTTVHPPPPPTTVPNMRARVGVSTSPPRAVAPSTISRGTGGFSARLPCRFHRRLGWPFGPPRPSPLRAARASDLLLMKPSPCAGTLSAMPAPLTPRGLRDLHDSSDPVLPGLAGRRDRSKRPALR